MYLRLWGSKERYKELLGSLILAKNTLVGYNKRMTLLDLGHVIATRYNVVLVSLADIGSATFFPLKSTAQSNPRMFTIGFVNKNHFVQVSYSTIY